MCLIWSTFTKLTFINRLFLMDFPLEEIFITIFCFLTFVDMEKAGEKEIQRFWFGGVFFASVVYIPCRTIERMMDFIYEWLRRKKGDIIKIF